MIGEIAQIYIFLYIKNITVCKNFHQFSLSFATFDIFPFEADISLKVWTNTKHDLQIFIFSEVKNEITFGHVKKIDMTVYNHISKIKCEGVIEAVCRKAHGE